MTIIQDHTVQHVNALSVGLIPGIAISATDRGNNSEIARYYAGAGYSIYFPAGDYEFDNELFWDTEAKVKVWGDMASLYQVVNGARLLRFEDCTDVEVCGLTLYGPYHQDVGNTTDGDGPLRTARCINVNVHDNHFSGYIGFGQVHYGGRNIMITNNRCSNATWTDPTSSSADIAIRKEDTFLADSITITGNVCDTNSHIGIQSLSPAKHIICSQNQVITRDANGVELIDYAADLRKASIELQYNIDPASGNDDADSAQHRIQIVGNNCQGARFSCISLQASPQAVGHTGGIRGVIHGNVCRYAALEQASVSNFINNGITVSTYRDLVISDNVVKNVAMGGGSEAGSAIFVQSTNSRSQSTGGTIGSLVVKGNIVTDCTSRGIRLMNVNDAIISNNLVRDCTERTFECNIGTPTNAERNGRLIVSDNVFVSELQVSTTAIAIAGTVSPDHIDVVVSGNRCEFTGTFTGTHDILQVQGDAKTIIGNRVIGPGGATQARGLTCRQTTASRWTKTIVANNFISGCEYGLWRQIGGSNVPDPTAGPLIHSNTTFDDCTNNILSTVKEEVRSGHWNNTETGPVNVVVWGDNTPTSGFWEVGDVIWHHNAASTEPMGWMCIGQGQGVVSTWIPMAAMP